MNQKLLFLVPFLLTSILGTSQNIVCLDIQANPNSSDPALSAFTKYIDVFGVGIYAESSISDEKIKHVAAIFAEWLDNNEDGIVDDMNVLSGLTSRNALMPIFSQEGSSAENTFFNNYNGDGVAAVCYSFEIVTTRPLTTQFDATLEENLHTISSIGYANAYPAEFSEDESSNSLLNQAMDLARGGHFTTLPNPYPAGAWYTYDDATCAYNCMATEYFYWGLTSKLGIQDYGNRCMEIANEWQPCTSTQFQSTDTLLYNLLTNPIGYVIPTNAPDGNYCPSTSAIENLEENKSLNVFPNPSSNELNISSNQGNYLIKIIDLRGELLYEFDLIDESETKIRLDSFSSGLYLIQAINISNNKSENFKFLKR